MSSASWIALHDPERYPAAAMGRLQETAATLLAEGLSTRAGLHGAWLARLADVLARVAPLITAAVAQTASEAELAGVANAERVLRAAEAWGNELARRSSRLERVHAMRWARLCRQGWADVALCRREYAATVYLGLDWLSAQPVAPIRILPGAESALTILADDPLVAGASWDLVALSQALVRWVRLS